MKATILLAIIDTHDVSGPGRQLVSLLRSLSARAIDCSILTFHREGRPPSSFAAFARAAEIAVTVIEERFPGDPRATAAAERHIRRLSPTIVQTHSYKGTALAWLLRARGLSFRWVGCIHGATFENLKVRAYHALDKRLLRRADRIVIVAEAQRGGLGGIGPQAHMIPNAVLTPPSSTATASPIDWKGIAQPRLGFVGRLSPEKGADLLLRAAAQVRARAPDAPWSLVIVGAGQELEALQSLSRSLGLERHIHWMGFVPEPWEVYGGLDCLVIPSLSEAMPNVLLEAIASDLRIIATDVGAIPAIISTGSAARVVPRGSVTALADAMLEVVLAIPEPDAARHDREMIRTRFSPQARAAAFLTLYSGLLGTSEVS